MMTIDSTPDTAQLSQFLEAISQGMPESHAASLVGWKMSEIRRFRQMPEFLQLISDAETYRDQSVEGVLYERAMKGNVQAIQLWLFNRAPDRWKDVKHIETQQTTVHSIAILDATKQGVEATLREFLSHGDLRELQPGGAIDVDSREG